MTDWRWLTREAIEIMQTEQIREHGGLPGIKDENAVESALARARNKASYGDPDVFDLAGAYLFGLARNHGFSDGNKRIAFLAAYTFLHLHGYEMTANDAEVVTLVMAVAAGDIDEDGAAAFFRDHTAPLAHE